ncbi:hypothetical protein BHM03_00007156 [Ensete ventricosum]|uniref:Uncharacterized protein n=1 Tax=Ensete ventricosum TaxID=4639 RepID=A0A445MC56_ENSVE|nr:hypothetical protein BHM03_00007156 [Ensete ventricosum]
MIQWDLARRFAEGIGKLAGNTLGDHWKKTERLTTRMTEVARLAGILVGKPLVSDEYTTAAQAFGRLMVLPLRASAASTSCHPCRGPSYSLAVAATPVGSQPVGGLPNFWRSSH